MESSNKTTIVKNSVENGAEKSVEKEDAKMGKQPDVLPNKQPDKHPAKQINETAQKVPAGKMTPLQKGGCITCGALGCLWIVVMIGAIIAWLFLAMKNDISSSSQIATHEASVNTQQDAEDSTTNVNGDSTTRVNDNTNVHRPNEVIINDVPEGDQISNTTDVDTNTIAVDAPDLTELDTGELVDEDGNSYGFAIEDGFVTDDLYAYQIGAYAEDDVVVPDWGAYQFTLNYPKVKPMPDEDTGSLWVGAVLDNDYFIQIGMMSTDEVDADGNMIWSYFWEMWDDQDNYLYGLQDNMSYYGWDQEETNVFSMACVDAETGTWEFWVNDTVVGQTVTGSCATHVTNSYIFWEMTTNKTDKASLPEFGPFTIGNFEYWDGFEWYPVEHSTLSYSYGRIVDGTVIDQAAVCPPYGAAKLDDTLESDFIVGSGVECLEYGSQLW